MNYRLGVFFLLLPTALLLSQNVQILTQSDLVEVSKEYSHKLLSGQLIEKVSKVNALAKLNPNQNLSTMVALYFDEYPTAEEFYTLDNLGIEYYSETWIPPIENHVYGFLLASLPAEKFNETIACSFIQKMDTAERKNQILNNDGTLSVKANLLWDDGYEGSGVKIGILDSGIDLTYTGSDLPSTFEYKDYSEYPNLDDTIANTVTGHGTHVTASALGRGVLSAGHSHWNNGKGAFKGSAPMADLVFLKIGLDDKGWATDAGMIGAIIAGVNTYKADILSMSYGGWDAHHDGSGALDQTVDWAFGKGVSCFASAGNSANDRQHWSGTVPANSESDFIRLEVNESGTDDTMLNFNLVWSDGTNRNDLSLQYFDSALQPLSDITSLTKTESNRGTESQYSFLNNYVPSGDGVYYLKVVNNSPNNQFCHIYEEWANTEEGTSNVFFDVPDPYYTIGSPALADNCMAVGAYVSKIGWTDTGGGSRWWGASYIINDIATFSSLGPRVDGLTKPDICAPGHVVVSLRDTDVYTDTTWSWIDNDGTLGEGDANYYKMQGTSMACPIAAGAAALYLEKNPGVLPHQVYEAIKQKSNQTGLSNLPNNTWGNGRLDIYAAARGYKYPIEVDGDMNDSRYQTLATYTSGRNGYGDDNDLGAIKFYSDGEDIYIGITGEVTANNNIVLFFDFSGVQGRGTDILHGGNYPDFEYCVFAYLMNEKLDLDADFGLGFNEGNSTQFEFFTDAIKYDSQREHNIAGFVGKTNQYGMNGTFDAGSIFGGTGYMTIAYDSSFAQDSNKGVEVKIPISAFTGVDNSQTLKLFAMISSMGGDVSNECIPGDPGPTNLGDVDFSAIPNQDFFTQPVKISGTAFVSTEDELSIKLKIFELNQNYPNPFNASTNIEFNLPAESIISLSVYDINGRLVKTIINNKKYVSGSHTLAWNALDDAGEISGSGVYIYKLNSQNQEKTGKMVLLR